MRAIHVFGMASTLNSTSDGAAPAVAQPQYLNYFTDNKLCTGHLAFKLCLARETACSAA